MKKKQTRKKAAQSTRASVRKAAKKVQRGTVQKEGRGAHQKAPVQHQPEQQKNTYAVQVKSVDKDKSTGNILSTTFLPYIGSVKRPLTLEEAEGHRDGLQRAGSGGRIIELPDGKVHEEWPALSEVETAKRQEEQQNQAGPPPEVPNDPTTLAD